MITVSSIIVVLAIIVMIACYESLNKGIGVYENKDKSNHKVKPCMYVSIKSGVFGTEYNDERVGARCADAEEFEAVKTIGLKCSKSLMDSIRRWMLSRMSVCTVKRYRVKNDLINRRMLYTKFTDNGTTFTIVIDRAIDFKEQRVDVDIEMQVEDENPFKLHRILNEIISSLHPRTGTFRREYFKRGDHCDDIKCDYTMGELVPDRAPHEEYSRLFAYIYMHQGNELTAYHANPFNCKLEERKTMEFIDEIDFLKDGEVAKEYWKGLME